MAFAPIKPGANEGILRIVLDIELDTDRLQVALDDRLNQRSESVRQVRLATSTRIPGADLLLSARHQGLLPSRKSSSS